MIIRILFVALLLFVGNLSAALAATPKSYEAWYETTITIPGQPDQKGKLHTYFDGTKQYSLQEDGHGNTSGTVFEIPFDSTLVDYMRLAKATSVGKKNIDGKSCEGWSYADQIMHRPSVNWIDDSGHLYFQEIQKYEGDGSKYEQLRKDFRDQPKSSELTTNPACKP